MLVIAICDDEPAEISKTKNYIMQYSLSVNMDFDIHSFSSGEELLKSKLKFDLIFLDIMMDGMNGLETARLIRESDLYVQIVYTAGFSDFSIPAFKTHPFDYIVKPLDYIHIENVLSEYIKYFRKPQGGVVALRADSGEITQSADNIMYMAYCGNREIIIYTLKGPMKLKGNISELYEAVDKASFFMPHRSYIVNMKYVRYIVKKDYTIKMTNGDIVPLSQRKRAEFKEALHNYMAEHTVCI